MYKEDGGIKALQIGDDVRGHTHLGSWHKQGRYWFSLCGIKYELGPVMTKDALRLSLCKVCKKKFQKLLQTHPRCNCTTCTTARELLHR